MKKAFKRGVIMEVRFFKVKVYVGVIVPNHSSGLMNVKICYPTNNLNESDWRYGIFAMFGVFKKPKLDMPITTDHFYYTTTLMSNDDSRDIKVEPISELTRFTYLTMYLVTTLNCKSLKYILNFTNLKLTLC